MGWILKFLKSSIGRKLIMSLTGLFLISFLVVHLTGNFQLLNDDEGAAFNQYAYFMTHNPLIKFISYGLYFLILLHALQGIVIWAQNRKARGTQKYAVKSTSTTTWASRSMALLGSIILIFIFIHMGDFWFKMKFGGLNMVQYEGFKEPVANLYEAVHLSFKQLWIVIVYLLSMIALGFHLQHGFWSAFQTLGLNHQRYTPLIHGLGTILAILLPLGFAIIPIYFFLFK